MKINLSTVILKKYLFKLIFFINNNRRIISPICYKIINEYIKREGYYKLNA